MPPFTFATFNQLADGLSYNEFMTPDGDTEDTQWSKRQPRIQSLLHELFQEKGVGLLVMQENDHFFQHGHHILSATNTPIHSILSLPRATRDSPDMVEGLQIENRLRTIRNAANTANSDPDGDVAAPTSLKSSYPVRGSPQEQRAWCCAAYTTLCRAASDAIPTFDSEHTTPAFAHNRLAAMGVHAYRRHDVSYTAPLSFPYVSPEGVSVYWNTGILKLLRIHTDVDVLSMTRSAVVFADEKVLLLEFKVVNGVDDGGALADDEDAQEDYNQHRNQSVRLLLGAAHLKSGEDAKGERRRVQQLKTLLADMERVQAADVIAEASRSPDTRRGPLIPLLLMDGNNNRAYESTVGPEDDTVSKLLAQHQMVDLAAERFKCIKMRHAQGGQPKKFGDLMVDGIDKMIVHQAHAPAFACSPEDTKLMSFPLETFRTTTPSVVQTLESIRNCPRKRAFLKRLVAGRLAHNEAECKAMRIPFLSGGADGVGDPDDVSDGVGIIHAVHNGEPWGPCMRDNLRAMQQYPDDVKQAVQRELGMSVYTLGEALMNGLYPNARAPSDHPPVVGGVCWERLLVGGSGDRRWG